MFRFSIRDLLWLTVVLACLAAWWFDRVATQKRVALEADNLKRISDKHQAEMLDWKFRAESLNRDIKKRGGETIFRQGANGEEVIVKTDTGSSAYYDPRQFIEKLKADSAAARAKKGKGS